MVTQWLPRAPEEITAAALNEILHANGVVRDATIRAVRAEPIGQGVGLLCQLARLEVEYDRHEEGAPTSLVAKLPTTVPETRGLVTAFNFYERETRFYQELAGDVSIGTAHCFHAAFDQPSGDFLLLLEDLSGRRIGNQVEGLSAADAELVVRELARLHAAWWNSAALDQYSWLPRSSDPVNAAGMMLYPMAWPPFMQRFGAELSPAMVAAGEKLGAQGGAILARFSDGPRTLCHGDPRADNMFFGSRLGEPGLTLIDWQIGVRGVGTYDLGYFLSQSVSPQVRRDHEQEWLRLYHRLLVEDGVAGYNYDQMIEDYRWTVLFCLAYPVMGGGLGDVANERGLALGRAMLERSLTAIADWNAAELLG